MFRIRSCTTFPALEARSSLSVFYSGISCVLTELFCINLKQRNSSSPVPSNRYRWPTSSFHFLFFSTPFFASFFLYSICNDCALPCGQCVHIFRRELDGRPAKRENQAEANRLLVIVYLPIPSRSREFRLGFSLSKFFT